MTFTSPRVSQAHIQISTFSNPGLQWSTPLKYIIYDGKYFCLFFATSLYSDIKKNTWLQLAAKTVAFLC